jgi:two-component system CheB/CheR fusion protein
MAGDVGNRFELASKPGRLYRHIGRYRPGDVGFSAGKGDGSASPSGQSRQALRKTVLADLCRRLVMDRYAPAAVLIDRHYECLYSLGPTERYLRVAPGFPTHDLLAMAAPALRRQLRSAIQQASEQGAAVSASGGRIRRDGAIVAFNIVVQHVPAEGEDLLLICFVDAASEISRRDGHALPRDASHVSALEQELEATRAELQRAVGDLEDLSAEQKSINEEALSVNEEYQSTNEELLTSKEELQSLNEELTALNGQLHETLDRARTTSDDLQNVLYSTDVATVFLDTGLNIRFFTPATRSLFNILPGDIGRPLADLSSLTVDGALLGDAHAVLQNSMPLEREIEARSGAWFARRILPYRTRGDGVEGVVITFSNITEQKQIAAALDAAREQAELANLAKSRFLATASHDLRQPLQTLALLQSLLMRTVEGEHAQKLVAKFDETLGAMSGMLNTLLDINQIEAGTVHAEIVTFPVDELLERMRDEFTYQAEAQKLVLRVVPCGLSIASDPRLLEQMIRNLISNALKYTKHGRVLVGCRRHKDRLDLEVWDTGVGIADAELQTIFHEYYQVHNPARARSRGLGLGLSIVERLGNLLGHKVRVRSRPGSGSVFVIEVTLPEARAVALSESSPSPEGSFATEQVAAAAKILVVEDDPEIRDLLEHLLTGDGLHVMTAPDGVAALDLVSRGGVEPDLLLSDYNLPNGLDGVQTAAKLREQLNRSLPTIILTGDISTETLRDIAQRDCVQLNKPVKLKEMTQAIQRLLAGSQSPASAVSAPGGAGDHPASPVIFIVDDDLHVREGIRSVLEEDGRTVEDYASCEAFLESFRPGRGACLLVDAYLPGMSGLVLLQRLRDAHHRLPAIMITGHSDVPMAVQAMRAGASDFIEKPVGRSELLASLDRALAQSRESNTRLAWQATSTKHIEGLTPRQLQVMEMVLAGHPSKNIAADLGISQRTVENHRASIMKRTGSKSLPALARLALAAAWNVRDELPPGKLPSF